MLKASISILLSVFLLLRITVPALELSELSKLPALLEHYRSHKLHNPQLSFLAFIELHYKNPQHHNQDHQKHHELPFANHHHPLHVSVLTAVFISHPVTTFISLIPLREVTIVMHEDKSSSSFSTAIWQPPKIG